MQALRVDPIDPCTLTCGVDLSTKPQSTGIVTIQWDATGPGVITEARVGATRDELVDRIARSTDTGTVWAVDVPFGWPIGFAEFLTSHREGPAALDPGAGPSERPWDLISHRETDRAVRKQVRTGFNVSFDKLGATAAAWSVVEHGLRLRGIKLDRSGLTGRVVETWPSAAWRAWGLHSTPAAKASWEANLSQLLDTGVLRAGDHEQELAANEHIRDALACALVARARALGLTKGPEPSSIERARREGWIHIPTAESLDELART
jgi:hypothetical protein